MTNGESVSYGATALRMMSKSSTIIRIQTMSKPKRLPPIHPGEILREEFLKPLGLSMNKLAGALHVPANRVSQIVEGRRTVTGETALRLARYFGTSPEFWLGMQKDYDLQIARDSFEAEVTRQVHPRKKAA
jgi:antitoxin HigA-1